MSTNLREKGRESPTVRHITGTSGLVAWHVGVTCRLAPTSRFG
jgi:hypothetical protein